MPLDLIFQNGSLTTSGTITTPNILYVNAATGNDSRTRQQAQDPSTPWLTISHALNVIGFVAGDGAGITVIVAPGTYNEDVSNFPSGISGNPFILRSSVQYGAIIKPTTVGFSAINFDAAWNIFDGFTVDGTNVQSNLITIESTVSNLVIRNSEIRNVYSGPTYAGIYGAIGPTNITIEYNIIHDIAVARLDNLNHGIYWEGVSSSLIQNNTIYNVAAYGIHLFGGTGAQLADNVIRNNTIYAFGIPNTSDTAGIITYGNNNDIYNNVIYMTTANAGASGIAVVGAATEIYNNTIWGTDNYAVRVAENNTVIRNNIFYDISPGYVELISGSGHVINTNLNGTDPLFVNLAAFNFHLQSGSPARNTGVTISMVTTDIEGTSRPQESIYDIGAYEYVP